MLHDASLIDTQPGCESSPFSPPAGFSGDRKSYYALMLDRWTSDLENAQRISAIVRRYRSGHFETRFTGPFAREAKAIVERLQARRSA